MVDKGTLPGANAEVRHREARWTAQAGQADTTTGRERAPDDHFRGASITKTFIATVLLQLEGCGLGVEFAETSCGAKGVGESGGGPTGPSPRWSARWTGGTSSRSTSTGTGSWTGRSTST
ncbi:serine hydrolase [Streptomyces koyangensis]